MVLFDARPTLSRAEARSVYDGFAVKGHVGGKDASSATGKMYNKVNCVAGTLMLPLMVYGAFSGEPTFNAMMWKFQIAVHIPVIYISYKAGFGSEGSKSA